MGERDRLNSVDVEIDEIRGTTDFVTYTGSAVSYIASSWVAIYSGTATERLSLVAVTITNAGAGLVGEAFRFKSGVRIFDGWLGTSNTFTSGTEKVLELPFEIGKGLGYSVEVYCSATTNATATLTSLKCISKGI